MVQQNEETGTVFKGNIGVEAGIPLIGKSKGQTGSERQRTIGSEKSRKLTLSPRAAAISQLRNVRLPVVMDDFHYLNRKFQGNLIRALKPLIFEGLPVVLIAIPHRRYDAVKVEREMTGRLESIDIPTWEKKSYSRLPTKDFLYSILKSNYKFPKSYPMNPTVVRISCRNSARNLQKLMGYLRLCLKKNSLISYRVISLKEWRRKQGKLFLTTLLRDHVQEQIEFSDC